MWQVLKAVTILFTTCQAYIDKNSFLFFSILGKKKNHFFLVIFTRRKKLFCFLNLSNKRYFSGSEKPPYFLPFVVIHVHNNVRTYIVTHIFRGLPIFGIKL